MPGLPTRIEEDEFGQILARFCNGIRLEAAYFTM